MKKLGVHVRRGDKVLIDGERHIATVDAYETYGGVFLSTVPDNDRKTKDVVTELGHNDDIEMWA